MKSKPSQHQKQIQFFTFCGGGLLLLLLLALLWFINRTPLSGL